MNLSGIMRTIVFFFLFYIAFAAACYSQDTLRKVPKMTQKNGFLVPAQVIDGDTSIHISLKEITVLPPFRFSNMRHKKRYSRLVRYVKKVYPYAKLIEQKYAEIQAALDTIPNKKAQKKFINEKEKELRAQFEGELVKLTILQGRILIKLVDRETGETTYNVVKQFKGSFSAFFWQSVARIFGSNLKSEYNAEGDDRMIEDIITRIENGQL